MFSGKFRMWCMLAAVGMALACGPAVATNFAVLLSSDSGGKSTQLEGCLEVAIGDVTLDYQEIDAVTPDLPDSLNADLAAGFKVYAPGQPHFGNARITADCSQGKRLLERDREHFIQVDWAEQPTRAFEAAVLLGISDILRLSGFA